MMYSKALLFDDRTAAEIIIQADSPRQQKQAGRQIKSYDEATWRLFRGGVVYQGNYAKFSQNPSLRERLLDTRGTILVEASPKDRVWGIGLSEGDPRAHDRSAWQGENLLGFILTRVRSALEAEDQLMTSHSGQ